MKKIVSLILALVIAMSAFSVGTFAVENEVKVTLDGFEIKFEVPGRLIGDRTMVPLRTIFEVLGAEVEWIPETREIISTCGEDTFKLAIGSSELYKNGELAYTMDVPPVIVEENGESRTLVPARAVSEAFGCTVDWDPATRTAIITNIDEDTVMTVAGFPIDYDLYAYFCNTVLSMYYNDSSVFDNDPAAVESFKDLVITHLVSYCSQLDYMAGLGFTPYSSEITAEVNSALETYKSYYGDAFNEVLESSNMTEKVFTKVLEHSALLENAHNSISSDVKEINSEELIGVITEKNIVLRAAHILCEDRETAEALLEEAKTANDNEFFALVSEYGTDPGMIGNPDGYYFTQGEMVEELESAVLASEIGETSDVVESEYGYHIIRRLPLDADFISENFETIADIYASHIYSTAVIEKIAEVTNEVVLLDKYNELNILDEFITPYFENAEQALADMLLDINNGENLDDADEDASSSGDIIEEEADKDDNTPAYDNDKYIKLI